MTQSQSGGKSALYSITTRRGCQSDIAFQIQDLGKRHGARILFQNVKLPFLLGARIGVIGPNGT